jgi:hypothetical protein
VKKNGEGGEREGKNCGVQKRKRTSTARVCVKGFMEKAAEVGGREGMSHGTGKWKEHLRNAL